MRILGPLGRRDWLAFSRGPLGKSDGSVVGMTSCMCTVSGKTMLAKRIPTVLPSLTPQESIDTTRIYSAIGRLRSGQPLMARRPFRSPHHTISEAGLVGGGSTPTPGEISMAHHGVLFLNELPEFNRKTLEVLQQPLEDRVVTISRFFTQ